MHKDENLKKHGVSTGFSTPIRQTGGKSPAFLDKSFKKKKLRRLNSMGILDEMDKLSCKEVKLYEKKILDTSDSDTINYSSPPRKLRSANKKRQHELHPPKKQKTIEDKCKDLKQYVITKEEEAAEALFALAQTFTNTGHKKSSEVTPNEAENTKAKMSQKRCPVHVYICRFIKDLQTTESEQLGIVNRSKQGDCGNAISDTNPCSQLLTETLSNQQQFSGCYQNWQNQRHEAMDLLSGSSLKIMGSLLATNKEKMQFSDPKKEGGLFFVDSSPLMLELTL